MTRPMRRLPRLGTCTRRLNQKKQSSGVPPLVMTIWRDVHLSKIGSPSLTSESKRPGAPVEADERRRPMIRSVPMLAALFLAGSFSATAGLGGDVATVALLAVGCSMSPSMTHAMPGSMAGTATSATKAADLRTGLNALLGEHVYLASAATNAALGGRQAEFEAAAAALDANSVDIAKAIGSVYGADAEDRKSVV